MTLDLTLIIPCYNEQTHIRHSLAEVVKVLSTTNLEFEIVLIDDCSTDNTLELLHQLVDLDPRIRVRPNERNLGRGGTVTRGLRESQAKVAGFIDIDLSTPPVYIPYLTRLILDDEADVATCHRTYKIEPRVFHRVFHRILLSHGYRRYSKLLFRHPLKDTEAGFKFFNRTKIAPIIDLVEDRHWFWDTEVMVYAHRCNLRIVEVDSLFIRRPEKPSTVKIVRDVMGYLRSSIRFFRRLRSFRPPDC